MYKPSHYIEIYDPVVMAWVRVAVERNKYHAIKRMELEYAKYKGKPVQLRARHKDNVYRTRGNQ